MNARRCLKIAARIGTLLERELGLGVDAQRLLTERLYLRDVLLVCDAHRGGELAALSTGFRRAAAEAGGAAPSDFGPDSGFGHSGFGSASYDSQFDPIGRAPSAEVLVRRQLELQRAAARRGGWMTATRCSAL